MFTNHRINLVFSAHGGNVISALNKIRYGLTGVGGEAAKTNRLLAPFSNTLKAIGTTLRYAFAGVAVYGAFQTLQLLREYQRTLGDITAIAEQKSGQPLLPEQLEAIGDRLIQISDRTITPVEELGDSVRNIYSTLQGISPDQATGWAEIFSKGARVAETDAYNFGNAVLGMRNAFQRSLDDIPGIANQFFGMIQRSAGITGDEWAKQAGRVVAGATSARISLEEMNAMMVIMSRAGGTAATNVRHLSQLLMRLRTPTQESEPLWSAIGLTPEALADMEGLEIIERLFKAIEERGGLAVKQVGDEALEIAEELYAEGNNAAEAVTTAGISGPAAQFIAELTGRIESARALAVLYRGWEGGQGVVGFDKLLDQFEGMNSSLDELNAGFDRMAERRPLDMAAMNIRNFRLRVVKDFEGIANAAARGISGALTWEHSESTLYGAGGAAAGLLLLRKARSLLKRGGGAAGIAAMQIGNENPPVGSIADPIWVMIHPASWAAFGLPGGGKGGPGGPVGAPMGGGGPWWARAARIAGSAAGVFALMEGYKIAVEKGLTPGHLLDKALGTTPRSPSEKSWIGGRTPFDDTSAMLIEGAERNMMRQITGGFGWFGGREGSPTRVDVTVKLEPTADAKKLIQPSTSKVHVPPSHWSGGVVPSSRGKPKTVQGRGLG